MVHKSIEWGYFDYFAEQDVRVTETRIQNGNGKILLVYC